MIWKFPGTMTAGGGSTSIEDMGLWDEREAIAKRLYRLYHAAQYMGARALPAWDSLNERTRKRWRKKAETEMSSKQRSR